MDSLPAHGSEPFPFDGVVFSPHAPSPPPSRIQRSLVAAVVLALHVLIAWLVESQSQRRGEMIGPHDEPVAITFIETLPRQVIRADRVQDQAPIRTVPAQPRVRALRPAPQQRAVADTPLRLRGPDGALRLPDGLMDELDRQADDPQFDFQYPGLAEAGRFLDHPPVLAYEATRFDKHWAPNEDVLTEVLRKAVEKSTLEVRIPIPGAPGRRFVCRVALLAGSGACGMESNGGAYFPGYDDPATLDPDEAAACQVWWDKIVGATSQDQWRATRRLYETECRKPLLKVAPAATPAPAAQ